MIKTIKQNHGVIVSIIVDFDLIAVTESRIIKNNISEENISLENYSVDHCVH